MSKQITKQKIKKGGPYTKQEIMDRKNEVHRLHFEYGYSARKIADLMKVNRNTINGDIDYWYSKIAENFNMVDPLGSIMVNIQRLDIQRSRLRFLQKIRFYCLCTVMIFSN